MRNRMIRLAALTMALHLHAAGMAFSQNKRMLEGRVLDSLTQIPLPYALIYITPDTSRQYLAFARTDDAGRFQLSFSPTAERLLLHIRLLGYEDKTMAFDPGPAGPLAIALTPRVNALREVVVAQARAPITRQSDTLSYDVKAFTDSTEYNVEDVLKKLPGITVGADGQIAVNGKTVERVLIEGSDLFGRRYATGTKNIRAGYLDQVEVISRYQENPVLNAVNTSDAVVLNLKLKSDKKNILNGTIDAGPGWGLDKSLKGVAHANVFSISSKFKALLISANGNTGTVSGTDEIESTYLNFTDQDVKSSLYKAPGFQRITGLLNPGLPAEFTDATRRSFATLRTSGLLNERWEINTNISFSLRQGGQEYTDRQIFFPDTGAYQLTNRNTLTLDQKTAGADMYLKYISASQSRSLQIFGRWDHYRQNNRLQTGELRGVHRNIYRGSNGENRGEGAATALFTQKTGRESVVQFQIKTARCAIPQTLQATNNDFPRVWETDTSLVNLSQQLLWRHNETELLARYTWSTRRFIAEVEPLYAFSGSDFQNTIRLSAPADGSAPDGIPVIDRQQSVETARKGLNIHLNGQWGRSAAWHLYLQGRDITTRYAQHGALNLQTLSFRAVLSKKYKKDSEGRFAYAYQEQGLPAHYFIAAPFLFDNFGIHEQAIRTQNQEGHSLLLHYGGRNTLKLRSWFVLLRSQLGQRLWRSSDRFEESLVVSTPWFSRGNNQLTLNGNWDQFVVPLKTNIRLQTAFSTAMGNFAANGTEFRLGNFSGQLGGNISVAPLNWLKCNLEGFWQFTHTFAPDDPGRADNRIHSWRTALTAMYHRNGWQAGLSWNGAFSHDNIGGAARLQGFQLRVQKRLTVGQKPLLLVLRVVNIPNIAEFSRLQSGDYFLFSNAVTATPAFALIQVDYAF